MANRYCDHYIYGTNIVATPTWGVPQDGDGLAKAAASAVSTAFISFSAVPTTGTISVCGVTISTSGVIGAASAAAAATALAANINATSAAVSSSVSNSTPQLRDLVWARSVTAGQVDIMMRAGSSLLNYANNVACLIASTFDNISSTAANHQFAGGVSGCYGYLMNDLATALASGMAKYTYGVWCANAPIGGKPRAGDIVYIRANKTIASTGNGNSNLVMQMADMGMDSAWVTMIVDDGTQWPADGATPVLTVQNTEPGQTFNLDFHPSDYCWVRGKQYASGQRNLVFQASSAYFGFARCIIGKPYILENVDFVAKNQSVAVASFNGNGQTTPNSPAKQSTLRNVRFYADTSSSGSNMRMFDHNTGSAVRGYFERCIFQIGSYASPVSLLSWYNQGLKYMVFESCKFVGFTAGSRFMDSVGTNGADSPQCFIFKNTDFGNLSYRTPIFGTAGGLPSYTDGGVTGLYAVDQYGSNDFMMDTPRGMAFWTKVQTIPTLNAVLLDGITPWSIRIVPPTAANISSASPFSLPPLSKTNTLGDGVRNLTVNLAIEKNLAWTKREVSIHVSYIEAGTGNRMTFDTWDASGAALTPSNATWSAMTADPADSVTRVTYTDGSTLYHTRYQFSVATPTAVAANTEIGITFRVHKSVADTTKGLILCPEILLS